MHYFINFSGGIKQDAATASTKNKPSMELLKHRQLIFDNISTILKDKCGCSEQYRCATTIYLLAMLADAYNTIIGCSFGATWHGREIIDGLNKTYFFLSMLIIMVQLPGTSGYEKHMIIQSSTVNKDISFEREFQKHLYDIYH